MTDRDTSRELVDLRTLREQRWTFERRMRRETWTAIEHATSLPVEEGGLGYRLGAGTLRRLHAVYVAEQMEAEQRDRAEHVHLAERELDRLAKMIDTALERDLRMIDEAFEPEPMLPAVLAAAREHRAIIESRRKLLGLDAAAKADVTVTVQRDLDAEIEALLGTAPMREEADHG